jgi:hypothetical protein
VAGAATTVNLPHLDRLVDAVQTNCHIADASHAADMTLCIYLLQMREFFRWEQGIAPMQRLPNDEVGAWLAQRESLWTSLEGEPFAPLPLQGGSFDPFDAAAVNAQLRPFGLVYGAGYTAPGCASFFLGELLRVQSRDGIELLVSGCEHARGLAAAPAVLAGSKVLLRQESLARWIWEKFEAWTLKRQEGPFKAALDAYGFDRLGPAAVERLIEAEAETLVLHELGEHRAGRLLGPDWQTLRNVLVSRRTDLYVRAARDHLADCLVTLPTLLQRRSDASLHFWFANLEGVRALLFPRLMAAYSAWCAGDDGAALRDALAAGATHWARACQQFLTLHRRPGADGPSLVDECVESPDWVLH